MTEKLFWIDPYLTEATARVVLVDGADVTLDRTIFYAESGGQESDRGTIGGVAVREARKVGREIVYSLAEGHGLAPGMNVTIAIDGERRRRLMRLHFAAEIVLELVYRDLAPIEKIGAHIAAEKARIDFRLDRSIGPALPALEEAANAIVADDLAIESAFSDEAAERRFWRIPGFAAVPCGGTHLKRTGEVGRIACKRDNIGKGKERIVIRLADD
ncbi:alanyl-tRNA editing protein [Oceanibacterium hippocampi]|uniref:Alanine--tRNA ligase n=1 Tax=Oceanibacterium hippocampi TaxID=745714 RepID=A0A1Y5RBN9_9PROT|nr:alanyl-tRNA editing protein [Oceanibacterium hippocampi]SLN13658.1 Alanine--tRNA ligase [Oceanibacterium hippocampi]